MEIRKETMVVAAVIIIIAFVLLALNLSGVLK